jgi:hypothetical protein
MTLFAMINNGLCLLQNVRERNDIGPNDVPRKLRALSASGLFRQEPPTSTPRTTLHNSMLLGDMNLEDGAHHGPNCDTIGDEHVL